MCSYNSETHGQTVNNISNTVNNTFNGDVNININVNVKTYMHPSLEHIDPYKIEKAYHRLFEYLPHVIKDTYFNKDHPENHSIYLYNLKQKLVSLFDGKDFQIVSHDVFFKNLFNEFLCVIDEHIEKLIAEEKIDTNDTIKDRFDDQCHELQDFYQEHIKSMKNNKYKTIVSNLWSILISNKDMIKNSTDKKQVINSKGELLHLTFYDPDVEKTFHIH